MNFGLERIHKLLDALNRPDERTKIVHVAGTNGKGSVCAYVSSVLLTCGYSVGRFNSPHLLEPRDSININGEPVSQSRYDEALSHVNELNKSIGASSFECLVGTAFYAFDKAQVDFVVLEVGLGGLLDATNAVRNPTMTVITAIGIDHAHILGNTIEEIASAKAGIMKNKCPVVIAPQDISSALDTLIEHAKNMESPYKLLEPSQFGAPGVCELDLDGVHYTYPIRLCGDYQRMNSATAVTALDWLSRLGHITMTTEQLATGMKNTRWPGRLDWITIEQYPLIKSKFRLNKMLVDGAHNPPATMALRKYIDTLDTKRVVWIIASTEGKDIHEMTSTLIREDDTVIAVPFSRPEGMPWIQSVKPDDIIKEVNILDKYTYTNLEEALSKASSLSENDVVVVLCGSLYLVADLYRTLK